MKKIIYWDADKKFKLTPRYIGRLKELGFNKIPTEIGCYDNSDITLINAVEQLRSETPQLLKEELSKCINHQSIQAHFMQVFTSFESFAVQFWIKFTEMNPHILHNCYIDNIYHGILYGFSYEEFKEVCQKWSLTISEEMHSIFQSLVVRRDVVNDLRAKRDKNHDSYLQFCADAGMRTFSHIPPIDGFKIVEYDETKYRSKITIQTNHFGAKYETLELIPI